MKPIYAFSLTALFALGGAVLQAETTPPPDAQDQIEKSFRVKPGGLLTFDSEWANAEIVTAETNTVRVEFTRTFKVSTAKEADELRQKFTLEMIEAENKVRVVVKFADDRNQTSHNKVKLECRITMPRKFNLDLRTVGSARIGDLDGTANISTRAGSLKLGHVSGPVTAKSEGGSIAIGDIGGNLEAHSRGGSTAIGRANGRVTATAEGGSVSIEEASDAIEVRAEGGSVSAYISKQPTAECKLTANAGNIDLRLSALVKATIDASCSAGRITSDFDLGQNSDNDAPRLRGDINGGGSVVKLRASAGNIHLRK